MDRDHCTARILLVDDFEPWRKHVRCILSQQPGLDVVADACDGLTAIHLVEETQPDLILLDIGLPSLSGIEVAQSIQHVTPASKILFVSENRDPDVIRAAMSAGGHGYVVKSDGSRDLLVAIWAVIQGTQFVSSSLADIPQLRRISDFAH